MKEPLAVIRPPVALLTMLALLLIPLTCETHAQRRSNARARTAAGARMTRDPEIARMLAELDARNIERTIRKLVSFGTRNTLSAPDAPKRGIGAPRGWPYRALQRAAPRSAGA